jgi:hypothetical protein
VIKNTIKKLDDDNEDNCFHKILYFTLYDLAEPKLFLNALLKEVNELYTNFYKCVGVGGDDKEKPISNYNQLYDKLEQIIEGNQSLAEKDFHTGLSHIYIVTLC